MCETVQKIIPPITIADSFHKQHQKESYQTSNPQLQERCWNEINGRRNRPFILLTSTRKIYELKFKMLENVNSLFDSRCQVIFQ